ncbi:hypothetical protein ACHAXS_003506 [Conticribra weissflogii]
MTNQTGSISVTAIAAVLFSLAALMAFHGHSASRKPQAPKALDTFLPLEISDTIPRQLRAHFYSDPKTIRYKNNLENGDFVDLMVQEFHRKTVIVNLAVGDAAARSNIIERCYFSARQTGLFQGYYAVLTDGPIKRYKYLMENDDKFFVLQIKYEDRRDDMSDILELEYFKSLIPKYIYSHPILQNVDNINYLDSDIIVGRHLNIIYGKVLKRRVQDLHQLPEGVSSAYFFQENHGNHRINGKVLHSGVSFLDRNSFRCMELWGMEVMIAAYQVGSDQHALTATYHKSRSGEYSDCVLFGLRHDRDIVFSDEFDAGKHVETTFAHVTYPKIMRHEHNPEAGDFADVVKSFHRNTVMINLSMGEEAAKSNLVERCHRSARVRGNFEGYFAILTDAPEGRYSDLMAIDDKFIVLQINDDDRRTDIEPLMAMKFFKTLIPRYVYSHPMLQHVENICYLDFDIVIGQDMNPFFASFMERKLQDLKELPTGTSTTYFFEEHHNASLDGQMFHGGIFFLDKNSAHCMELWGNEIAADGHDKTQRDQISLTRTYKKIVNGEYSGCMLFRMIRENDLLFPDESDMKNRNVATFIHVTNTFRAFTIPVEVQDQYFVSVFTLSKQSVSVIFTSNKLPLFPFNWKSGFCP